MVINNLTNFIKLLRSFKVIYLYKDGDTFGFVWNWWNPISWFFVPILVILNIFLYGYTDTMKYKHELGIGMKPFFKENPDKLEWMK